MGKKTKVILVWLIVAAMVVPTMISVVASLLR